MNNSQKYTGLSLSFCILDLLKGRIREEDVLEIYCGFENYNIPPENYYDIYWKKFSRDVVNNLISRLTIKSAICEWRNISQGHWMVGKITEERCKNHEDRVRF